MIKRDIAVNIFAEYQIVAAENTPSPSYMDFTAKFLANMLVRECSDWKLYMSSSLR